MTFCWRVPVDDDFPFVGFVRELLNDLRKLEVMGGLFKVGLVVL